MRYLILISIIVVAGSAPNASAQTPDVTPAHYHLKVHIDQAAGKVTTDARIRLPSTFSGNQATFVISGAQKIASATAAHASVEVSETDVPWKGLQKIVVTRTDRTKPFDIRIQSSGTPNPGGNLPINIVSPKLVELSLDGMWLPVVLGFTTPFTVDAEIAGLDRSLEVVAGGTARRSGNVWTVKRTVGDFDFAFAAMPDIKVKKSARFTLLAQDTTTATARAFWHHGQAAFSYLENWFGKAAAEPVKTVIIRRERASGYARKGYIVVTESSRRGDAAIGKFIAHEIAHLWWAPVDPNTEDRWLQESMAEYAALRYVEHALGTAVRDSILAQKRISAASAGAVLGTATRTDRELYDKGPVLLVELEQAIGRSNLDTVLRTLARNPPTKTNDFMNALRNVAGDAAATRFEQRMRATDA